MSGPTKRAGGGDIAIDCDFPGGNIIVKGVEGDTVRLDRDLRDTAGSWFAWHFRVRRAGGRKLRFEFADKLIGLRGPAVSTDGGMTWRWLDRAAWAHTSFEYAFGARDDDVRFCFTIPYVQAHLDRFLRLHAGDGHLRREVLCVSRKGREVALLRAGRLDGRHEHRLLLTCRHHACESVASYVLEGILAEALADSAAGRWLRERVELLAVPFVDVDGVEQGDQGKNRIPHDHGRDYTDQPIYPSVRAIMDRGQVWADGTLRCALDIHCPMLERDYIYFAGSPKTDDWQDARRFIEMLDRRRCGPLRHLAEDDQPFGTGWNKTADRASARRFTHWAAFLPGMRFALVAEIPYAVARGETVTAESARAFGRDVGKALQEYLASQA